SGVIMMHDDNLPLTLSMGQMYVPFGVYESNMISDPLTLELGETRESAVQLSFESNGATAGLYVFNGDVEEGLDEDKVTQFGIALGFGNDNFSVGVDYISAISDTDAVQDFLGVPAIIKQVAGISAHAVYNTDAMSMIVEYVGALDKFDASEIVFNGNGAQPAAANVEFGFNFPVAGRDSTVAIGYQVTEEAWDLGLPESRAMIAFSMGLYEATSLSFEYLSDSDYEPVDGGSGESSSTFTVQLAAEF
ncbi:MAG: LbtU family siderophore porin, partial [Gammaproteobacteria bacterium]|nr:LbtU family siderophore porin [Gammaproteobacteria bacterium]